MIISIKDFLRDISHRTISHRLLVAILIFIFISILIYVICLLTTQDNKREVEVYALPYAHSRYWSESIYEGGKKGETVDFAWIFYLIKVGHNRVLIDTGFSDHKHRKNWGIQEWREITSLLAAVGESPESISHVIITHADYDHMGLIHIFKNAHFYMHKDTFKIIMQNALFNQKVKQLGPNLFHVIENERHIMQGLRIFHVGGHTYGSVAVEFIDSEHKMLFPGDNCYLVENCRERKYIGSVKSRLQNHRFIDEYFDYEGLILSPHDPLISHSKTDPVLIYER